MEFKSLRNIESSFKQVRGFTICFLLVCVVICLFTIYKSYEYSELQRQKIYILDEGKSLMLALSQDITQNRPVEAKEHVRRFHELFFTLAPDKSAIESNIKRALFLADKSAYIYYKDLAEKGYYNRVVQGSINQNIIIDSLVFNFDTYPYQVATYARQVIIRESNITERSLNTRCLLINSVRSENNPHGFLVERFEIIENRDLRVFER